jgi:predicted nuclease with TOPRIM domain
VDALRIKYNELTEKFNSSKSSVERATLRKEREDIRAEMNEHKNRIEEAKVMLEKKIPQEADLYKAKPEWIK